MPKKTLALISILVLITVILFVVALRSGQTKPSGDETAATQSEEPTPTQAAKSVLTLSPNPVTVSPGGKGEVDVVINTDENAVTAVQLEVSYDPRVVTNVDVVPGPLFSNAVVLIDNNDAQTGRLTYAFGITPNSPTIQGTGTVATITFTATGTQGQQSEIALLPETLVTARGVATSVLKSATGAQVIISGTERAPTVQQGSPSAGF